MSIHPFTSESYSEADRTEAWQDVLGGFGLRSQPMSAMHGEHATAFVPGVFGRRRADAFWRGPAGIFAAASGAPICRSCCYRPKTVRCSSQTDRSKAFAAGRIILLCCPRQGDWQVAFHRNIRAIVMSVTVESFGGRRISLPEYRGRRHRSVGRRLADVLRGTLEATSEALENPVAGSVEHYPAQSCRDVAHPCAPDGRAAPPKWWALARNRRCSIAFTRRSSASSAIPISRPRGSRR